MVIVNQSKKHTKVTRIRESNNEKNEPLHSGKGKYPKNYVVNGVWVLIIILIMGAVYFYIEFNKRNIHNSMEREVYEILPNAKYLFDKYFEAFRITGQAAGFYTFKKDTFFTSFDTTVNINISDTKYSLFYFKGGMAGKEFNNEEIEKIFCHACSGILSIVKLKKESEGWIVDEFIQNCNCGGEPFGNSSIPSIVNIENKYYYLKHEVTDGGQGYYESYLDLCNFFKLTQHKGIQIGATDSGANDPPTINWTGDYYFEVGPENIPQVKIHYKGFDENGKIDKMEDYNLYLISTNMI